jgi:DNA-binding transcriptional regulator YdaS (Cro superfamily)
MTLMSFRKQVDSREQMAFIVAIYKAGGYAALAEGLGVSRQAIYQWRDKRVPAERVLQIEKLTGVTRHELRPDLYPDPNTA